MMEQLPITACQPGAKVRVVALATTDNKNLRKLTTFGIMPGVQIELVQVFPTYVLQIDNTLLALDWQIANKVIVQK